MALEPGDFRCQLEVANTLSAAQSLLEKSAFDLLVMDWGNDRGRAAAFIRSVRANSQVPIVVFSGSLNVNAAYAAGANAFVSKSMDLDVFLEHIKGIFNFWIRIAELPL